MLSVNKTHLSFPWLLSNVRVNEIETTENWLSDCVRLDTVSEEDTASEDAWKEESDESI